ncbi:Uncharacterised protein [Serratia liquefaciens]|jgi:hypothetical protein|nr:Uncharacterised protein [Serratia liquefaciens]
MQRPYSMLGYLCCKHGVKSGYMREGAGKYEISQANVPPVAGGRFKL